MDCAGSEEQVNTLAQSARLRVERVYRHRIGVPRCPFEYTEW